jgi:hypothetical protein
MPGQSGGANTQPVRWSDRWLAFATDTGKGILGTSVDNSTAEGAESSAMQSCQSQGGSSCEITLSMSNGCGALAVGAKLLVTGHDIGKQDAERAAMSKCSKDDTSCRVLQSACSYAVRVQ